MTGCLKQFSPEVLKHQGQPLTSKHEHETIDFNFYFLIFKKKKHSLLETTHFFFT